MEKVVSGAEQEAKRIERERWLRRQAMQIVVQLPEEDVEALSVLDYARALLRPASRDQARRPEGADGCRAFVIFSASSPGMFPIMPR